jgi:hypothetical protein
MVNGGTQTSPVKSKIAFVRWAPTSDDVQTITDAQGVVSVARTSIGLYVITFDEIPSVIVPLGASYVDNGATLWVEVRVKSTSASAGTATVNLSTVAYASVASGPSLSDTLDELCFSFILMGGAV